MTISQDPPRQRGAAIGPATGADASVSALIDALTAYLVDRRDPVAMRAAIARWCHDVDQMKLEPQVLLVHFKQVLDALPVSEQSPNYDQRLADRREIIRMCIEEFYREKR